MTISQIIKERGPISRAEIAKRMRISEREVRALIAEQNAMGVPLVFSGKGFIYATKRADVTGWARNQVAAAKSMLRKVAAVTKTDVEGVARGLFT